MTTHVMINETKVSIVGSFVIFVLAALIHSLYDVTDLVFLKPFCPINESVWEHMKMMNTAGLMWMIYEHYLGMAKNQNYYFARGIGLFSLVFLVPGMFYTYTGFTDNSILVIDIFITLITAVLSQKVFMCILRSKKDYSKYSAIGIAITIVLFILFVYFTYNPPVSKIFIE